jgi:hypothetical protein
MPAAVPSTTCRLRPQRPHPSNQSLAQPLDGAAAILDVGNEGESPARPTSAHRDGDPLGCR